MALAKEKLLNDLNEKLNVYKLGRSDMTTKSEEVIGKYNELMDKIEVYNDSNKVMKMVL